MQNRYTGDVGDFGKYGLLRALCGRVIVDNKPEFKLGIIWCLFPDESHTKDGLHISYLDLCNSNNRHFRHLDPSLYDQMFAFVVCGNRNVAVIQKSVIFSEGTGFFAEPLSFNDLHYSGPLSLQERLLRRNNWLETARKTMQPFDLVFFDPDNGIASDSLKPSAKKAPKFIFFPDLNPYIHRGQSIIIYHHIGRHKDLTAEKQSMLLSEKLIQYFKNCDKVWPLLYRRGTCRVFLIIPAKSHEKILEQRLEAFLKRGWERHFQRV
jgi:hypothetical protein